MAARNFVSSGANGLKAKATKLQELEKMAMGLLATARKLPPGPERRNILQEIGRFRSQIVFLQDAGLRPARQGLKAKGKWYEGKMGND
jgi:hypothetical protein